MSKLFLIGRNGGLYPTGRLSADAVSKLSGKEVLAEVTRPRNLAHHRKFFAMCGFLAEHSDYSTEQIVDIFKLRAGLTIQSQLRDGTIVQHPGSIAFAKMDQTAFEAFYEECLNVVAKDILPGVARKDLERELLEFLK